LQKKIAILELSALCQSAVIAQVQIKGTIYDRTQLYPMQGVSVMGHRVLEQSLIRWRITMSNCYR